VSDNKILAEFVIDRQSMIPATNQRRPSPDRMAFGSHPSLFWNLQTLYDRFWSL